MNPLNAVQTFYAALHRGDVPAVLGMLDPQVEWIEAERFPYYNGTWHGPQAVLENLLMPLAKDWENFTATAEDFVVDADRVVALGRYAGTYRRTGRSMSAPFAHLWTVRDGKVTGFLMYTDTAKVLEALQP
jgi:ketosteroid isomerase-like protein